jgi:hypothetical protein
VWHSAHFPELRRHYFGILAAAAAFANTSQLIDRLLRRIGGNESDVRDESAVAQHLAVINELVRGSSARIFLLLFLHFFFSRTTLLTGMS